MPTTEEQLIIDEALRLLSPEKDPEVAKSSRRIPALSPSGQKAFRKEIDPHGPKRPEGEKLKPV